MTHAILHVYACDSAGDYSFSAVLSEDQTYDGTPVVFDVVRNNYGGGYSDLSGFFTAFGMCSNNIFKSESADKCGFSWLQSLTVKLNFKVVCNPSPTPSFVRIEILMLMENCGVSELNFVIKEVR